MTRRLILLGLATTAVLAAACGGSQPTTPTPIVVTPQEPTPPPPPPPPPPVLGITRILAFGDSMTEGTVSIPLPLALLTAGKPESYPFKLHTLASARYTTQSIVVLNAGKAGEVATDSLTAARFTGALSEAKPQVLLLMEGANDLNGAIVSLSATVNAMEDRVREAQGRGIFVMVATIPPQRPGPGTKTSTPDLLSRYNADLRTMAAKKGAQLVDVNALLPVSLIGQDGLHPTEAGYDRLAEIFLDAIKGRYEQAGSVAVR